MSCAPSRHSLGAMHGVIYSFIFGCAGSSLLHRLLSSRTKQRVFSLVAPCGGVLSSRGGVSLQGLLLWGRDSRACRLQWLQLGGFVVPCHVESLWTRNQIYAPCLGRRILNLLKALKFYFILLKLFILHWNIANQQCRDDFRWPAKGFNHTYTCVHSAPNSPPIQAATEHWVDSLC